MKKSLYRKVMLIILIICLVLLISIAIKTGVFVGLEKLVIFDLVISIITNSYFSGTLCSVLAVLIIYTIQVNYSKIMIKKDFRCNEIIEEVYDGIEAYCEIAEIIPMKASSEANQDISERMKSNAKLYYDFYKANKAKIYIINLSLSYENNDILVESLQSCFLINLNFKLLNIINNIKNRLPNLRTNYPEIEQLFENYEKENDDQLLLTLGDKLSTYFVDLRCMAVYWKTLFDYLEYDPTYIKTFINIYNANYDIGEDIKQSAEVRNSRAKEIDKKVRKAMWKYTLKDFWNK